MSRLADLSRELSESFTLGGGGYALKWKEQRIGKRRMELSSLILVELENPSTGDEHIDEENEGGKLIDELEGQIDDLKKSLKMANSHADTFKEANESLGKHRDALQKANRSLEEFVDKLRAEVKGLEEGGTDIRIKAQKKAIANIQKANDDLHEEVTDLEKAKVDLIEQGDARERYVLGVNEKVRDLEKRNAEMSETLLRGSERIESLESELTEAGLNAEPDGPGETPTDSPGGSPSGD